MTRIVFEHTSKKTDAELVFWMEKNLQTVVSDKTGFERIFVEPGATGKTFSFTGRTVKGTVNINNSLITIIADIPLLYRPLIPAIKTAISNIFKEL